MTNREFVSKVRHTLKTLNIDERMSNRFILQVGRDYVQNILANRPLTDILRDNSFSTLLECFPMEKIDTVKCCDVIEFRTCQTVMKSKKKIPDLFNSKIGLSVISVINIDRTIEYQPLRNIKDFINESKRMFGKHSKYYYITNGYLYVLNSETELVHIEGLFIDEKQVKEASDCTDCPACTKILDMEFKCPAKFLSVIHEQVANTLRLSRTIIEDENPDGDSNQKSEKQA